MHVKKQNGRVDLTALCAHYQGAGNTTRRIAEATRLRKTLHYKNERLLFFATFLSKVRHMFNLSEEEDKPFTESAKLRFLMEKVQNPQLEADISALKVKAVSEERAFCSRTQQILSQRRLLPCLNQFPRAGFLQ